MAVRIVGLLPAMAQLLGLGLDHKSEKTLACGEACDRDTESTS